MQLDLDFEAGLTERFPDLIDLVAAVVYGSRSGLGGVASALDMAPSQLSRMLNRNPDDLRHLPAHLLPKIVSETGDKRIVFWFVEKFLEDTDTKRKRTLDELAALLPEITRLVKGAK